MSLMEQKSKIDCLSSVGSQLALIFEQRAFGKRSCFINPAGIPFHVFAFPGEPALCVEYAESEEDASNGRFEDGALFYLDDYETEASLLKAILAEIEIAE